MFYSPLFFSLSPWPVFVFLFVSFSFEFWCRLLFAFTAFSSLLFSLCVISSPTQQLNKPKPTNSSLSTTRVTDYRFLLLYVNPSKQPTNHHWACIVFPSCLRVLRNAYNCLLLLLLCSHHTCSFKLSSSCMMAMFDLSIFCFCCLVDVCLCFSMSMTYSNLGLLSSERQERV